MTGTQRGWLILLAVFALVSGWWLWSLTDDDSAPPLTGPPRSDYSLENFQLVAMDEHGRESFSVRGPRLSRHPFLGTMDIDSPRFEFPDADGGRWQAQSGHAWVAADGKQLRLYDDYVINGPPPDAGTPLRMYGPDIRFLPDDNVAETDSDVTIRDGRSILRGHGMRAELDDRHVVLSQFDGRFQTAAPKSP
ncbi:MAG: LPS export ABC transporter periplasmic protein LptC [Xanthomonadales bacterium]|nr:LPS export ABC transporter periplasmic protein LptC [Xanthomonadales bacterium]